MRVNEAVVQLFQFAAELKYERVTDLLTEHEINFLPEDNVSVYYHLIGGDIIIWINAFGDFSWHSEPVQLLDVAYQSFRSDMLGRSG